MVLPFTLSQRVLNLKPSATLAVSAKAAALKEQGQEIISLGMGEPDFDTPTSIKNFAKQAIDLGKTKYTAVDGVIPLKQAIVNKFKKDNQLTFNLDQILVSCGAKQSCYNLFQALLNPEDEVIIPAPYWVSYPSMASLAGAKSVILPSDHTTRFKITPDDLAQAITPKTKLFLLNNPSNPSGMCYTHAELKAIGQVLENAKHVCILLDDIYEHILWTKTPFANLLTLCPNLANRTVVINGVSKAYAMTGWRIGYAGGPTSLIQAMKKIQGQSTSNPSSISQEAALQALTGDQHCIDTMRQAYKTRHDYLVEHLNQIPGIECEPADGTFYAFACVQKAIRALSGVDNDEAFCDFVLEKAKVALVPGSAFGCPGYVRFSFSTHLDNVKEAIHRIKALFV